ncbi:hypothetical protein WJX74_007155 [Apatococcus lobatus]|uniref:Uncharacterized protein n=1 Tax=Apatococcus lobatus TaxID=904363 RepID=A0AAW1QLW4_9CHLO
MGKNQQHKQMQRQRHSGATEVGPDGQIELAGDGTVDVSFHSPAWHAARVAALQTERMSWEDWKLKQKEEEAKASAQADEEERLMREYRAQLDADRAKRLSKGTNNTHLRDTIKDKKASKKRKQRDSDKEKRRHGDPKSDKQKKSKKRKKSKRQRSSLSDSEASAGGTSGSSCENQSDGPVRLSEFLK